MALTCYICLPQSGVAGTASVRKLMIEACRAATFEPVWVERTFQHSAYWPDLRAAIADAQFVLADFSAIARDVQGSPVPDPDVMTEASLARFAERKPLMVVRVSQNDPMPLDWADVPVFEYQVTAGGLEELIERLTRELTTVAISILQGRGETLPPGLKAAQKRINRATASHSAAKLSGDPGAAHAGDGSDGAPPGGMDTRRIAAVVDAMKTGAEVPDIGALAGPTISSDPALRPLRLLDVPAQAVVMKADRTAASALAVRGEVLAVGAADGDVRIFDTHSGELLRTFKAGNAKVIDCTIDTKQRHVLCVGDDKAWRFVRIEDGTLTNWARAPVGFTCAAIIPQVFAGGDVRAVLAGTNGQVSKWSCSRGERLDTWSAHDGAITAMAITKDGNRFVSGGDDGNLRVFEVGSARDTMTIGRAHDGPVMALALDSSGSRAVSAARDGAKLWDLGSGEELNRLVEHEGHVVTVAFLPNTKLVVTGGDDGRCALWDARARQLMTTWTAHAGSVSHVQAAGDDRIATAGTDGRIVIWDMAPTIAASRS